MEDMQVVAKKPEAQWAGKLKLEKRSRWLLRAGRGEITPKKLEIEEKFSLYNAESVKQDGWLVLVSRLHYHKSTAKIVVVQELPAMGSSYKNVSPRPHRRAMQRLVKHLECIRHM